MLEIFSNGSKWAGENPDSIETLCDVLTKWSLDPVFEKYGNFIQTNPEWVNPIYTEKYKGCTYFTGNFKTLSHVFRIVTDEPEVIKILTKLIHDNQHTEEYQNYKREMILQDQRKEQAEHLFNKGKISHREYYKMLAGA